jgi:hypothetical protein
MDTLKKGQNSKESKPPNQNKDETVKVPNEEQASRILPKPEIFNLKTLTKMIENIDLNETAPNLNSPPLKEEEVISIIERLAHRKYLIPKSAFASIALLCLKGALSKTAPDKMYVEIRTFDNKLVKVTKGELMQIYEETTNNRYIRRLAETLAIQISTFAERNELKGDLAYTLEIGQETDSPLTAKELAWASSFCQNVKDLDKLASPRIRNLLNKNYLDRFERPKNTNKIKNSRRKIKKDLSENNVEHKT